MPPVTKGIVFFAGDDGYGFVTVKNFVKSYNLCCLIVILKQLALDAKIFFFYTYAFYIIFNNLYLGQFWMPYMNYGTCLNFELFMYPKILSICFKFCNCGCLFELFCFVSSDFLFLSNGLNEGWFCFYFRFVLILF